MRRGPLAAQIALRELIDVERHHVELGMMVIPSPSQNLPEIGR